MRDGPSVDGRDIDEASDLDNNSSDCGPAQPHLFVRWSSRARWTFILQLELHHGCSGLRQVDRTDNNYLAVRNDALLVFALL